MAASESSMASSMFTSITLAPLRTCSAATSSAVAKSPARISSAKRRDPVTLVRSPIIRKLESSRSTSGSSPARRVSGSGTGMRARGLALGRGGDGADVVRGGAAAAAHDVHEPARGELAQLAGRLVRALVVLAEGVRQAGVGVAAGPAGGDPREVGEVWPHLARAEGAVEAHAEWPRVGDRDPERLDRLAGQRAAAAVGDRRGDHHRQADAGLLGHLLDGRDGRLGGEAVDDRLDQQQVGAAVHEAAHLLGVGGPQLLERDGALRGVLDVGRDGQHPVGRADGPRHEARLVRGARGPLVGRRAGQARGLHVEVADRRLGGVVGLRDGRRAERVGLDDVGAGLEEGVVDAAHDVRARQRQDVVVALQGDRVVREALAAEVRPPPAGDAGSWSPWRRRGSGSSRRAGGRARPGRRSSSRGG